MSMRFFTSLGLAAVLIAVSARAQQPATTNAPKIVCDEPVFDFGTVDPSEAVEHTFLIRNEGTLTLELTRVHPSCGCTVANVSQNSIPPGGESRITSRLSLQGRSGPQQKSIVIDSNDPNQPQLILMLRGIAGSALNVMPTQLAMPKIAPGSTPSGNVIISAADGVEFRVTAVETTSDLLEAKVDPIEANRSYRITIGAKQPLSSGAISASVVVSTDHPKRARIDIPVSFVVSRELVVAPREIIFDHPSDEPSSRFVLIRNADGTPIELDGLEPPDSAVQIETYPFGASGMRIQLNNLVPSAALNGRVLRIHVRNSAPVDVPIRILGQG